jgi:acyl-CoA synthetase (AMP-forming)/AMP-acid ligase II
VNSSPLLTGSVTLGALFAASRARFGERLAVIQGERAWTYAELDVWANTVARRLGELGVGQGARVGVFLPNSVEWVVTALAAARLGAVILPINLRYRPDELRKLLEGGQPSVVVFSERFLTNPCAERLEEALPELRNRPLRPGLPRMVSIDPPRTWAEPFPESDPSSPTVEVAVDERDPFVVFWTSGTTGEPKGVLHTHQALRNVWSWTALIGYGPDERVLTVRPYYYIAGAFWSLFGPLLHGATIVIAQRLSGDELLELMARQGVTVLLGGPTVYESLLEHPRLAELSGSLQLRRGSFGGGAPGPGFVRRVKQGLGLPLLLQVYGMTELQGFTSSTRPDDPDEVADATIGQPLPGFEFQLRDELSRPVADGQAGELFVRGNTLAGYFRAGTIAPGVDQDGWFATGDVLLRRADGNYVFQSRARDIAKVRGENVALAELDAVLTAIPGVARAIAIALPDARDGNQIRAVVAPATGVELSEAAIVAACRAQLAPFKVPKVVTFVAPSFEWPATITGKLQRERVRELIEGA